MGQQAFKAATSRLSRAGTAAAAAATRTSEPSSSAAVGRMTSKQVPRTHPSNTAGFQRGESNQQDVRDTQQQEFLQRRAGGASMSTEMPDDLVQFLKSAGPLQKKEVKAPKSDGKSQASESSTFPPTEAAAAPAAAASAAGSKRRRREMMPLAANVEGFGTERTTNFSYDAAPAPPAGTDLDSTRRAAAAEEEPEGVYDVLDLYRLLVVAPSGGSDNNQQEFAHIRDADVRQRMVDAQQYLEVPIVVKESEEDGYVGVHQHTLETLIVPPVPKTIVKLVLEDLVDSSQSRNDPSA
jgi:hypothetical protein